VAVPRSPEWVKPICGILVAHQGLVSRVEAALADLLGAVEDRSPLVRWNWSDYYAPEMGSDLWRCWLSFGNLAFPDAVVSWKLATNEIEGTLAVDGRRQANIDPGYLTATKLVLASTKDAPHRLYLGSGIYGEVTLVYERGAFRPLPYTYRDYAEPASCNFFQLVRTRYLQQRRAQRLQTIRARS